MACWALKTRESSNKRQSFYDKWDDFLSESVIALGWEKIEVSPDRVNFKQLSRSIQRVYGGSNKSAMTNARTILKFVNLDVGDEILLCQGYNSNYTKTVHLYGIATVKSIFYDDKHSKWWHFKHKAIIRPFGPNGKDIPKTLLAKMLDKGSLLLTVHEISKKGFEEVIKWEKR